MDVKHKLLMLVFDLVLPLAVGYALARQHRFRMPSVRKMMTANIMVVAPVMALMSLWAVALEAQLIWLPFLGVAMQATAGGIGMLRARAKYDGPLDRGSFILSAMLSNRGIVGTITVFLLFGEAGFAYGQLIMLLASFVLYGFCFPMAHYYRRAYEPDPARPISLRAMFFTRNQFALVGIAIGLTLNLAGLQRPELLNRLFPYLVHLSMWLFLIPIGKAMEFTKMRPHVGSVLELAGIKFVATPIVIYLLAWSLGLRGEILGTVAVLSCAPTAIFAVVVSELNDLNVHLSMAAFVVTTMLYIAIIFPLIFVFSSLAG